MPESLLETILIQPWIWIFFSLVICYLIVAKWKKKDTATDPSTKPWWGRQVRKDVTMKDAKKRMSSLGKDCNAIIEKGISIIGIAKKIEYDKMLFQKLVIDPKTKKREWKPDYYYRVDRIQYRKKGFFPWLMSIFGLGLEYLTLTPDSYVARKEKNKTYFSIDPNVHLVNDSGVWTVSNQRSMNAVDEFSLQAWNENLHGSELDMLRRIAVHSPSVASVLEKASHEAYLKEQERKSKMQPYI